MNISDDADAYISNISSDVDNYMVGQNASPDTVSKIEPDFWKKLDMVNTGVHRGVTNFTHALMSKGGKVRMYDENLPIMKGYQEMFGGANVDEKIKQADAEINKEQQHNIETYSGYYPQIGEVAGETLATMPFGGLFNKVAQGAQAMGKMAAPGFKTLAKYGTAGAGGTGILAGIESQRYDPENPGQLFNAEAAQSAIKNPMAYIMLAAATKLQTWGQAAKDLGEAKKVVPNVMARNLKTGPTKTLEDELFGAWPAFTGQGKQINAEGDMGNAVAKWISSIANDPYAVNRKDFLQIAGKKFKEGMDKLSKTEDLLWDKGFKTKPITDTKGVLNDTLEVFNLLKSSPIDRHKMTNNFIKQTLKEIKGEMTVGDAKRIRTLIGNAMTATNKHGAEGLMLKKQLQAYRDKISKYMENSLGPKDLSDFHDANTFSSMKFQMMDGSTKIRNAMKSELSARKLIKDLVGEEEVTDKAYYNMLPKGSQKAATAYKLRQIFESSDVGGDNNFNLQAWLTKTKEHKEVSNLLNPQSLDPNRSLEGFNKGLLNVGKSDAYKSLEGLNKYLSAIQEGGKTGWFKQGMALGALSGAGMLSGGMVGAAVPLVSYTAAHLIANHSPIKSILHALPKKLSESTYNYLIDKAGKHLTRAGFFISDDGTLKHKDEDKE